MHVSRLQQSHTILQHEQQGPGHLNILRDWYQPITFSFVTGSIRYFAYCILHFSVNITVLYNALAVAFIILISPSLHYFMFAVSESTSVLLLPAHLHSTQVQLTSGASVLAHHAVQRTGSRYDHSLSYSLERGFARGGLPNAQVCPEGTRHISWQKVTQRLQQPLCDPACLKCQSSLTSECAFQSSGDNGESLYPEQLQGQHWCDMLGNSGTTSISATHYSQLSANLPCEAEAQLYNI